jgi:hypothetical protein
MPVINGQGESAETPIKQKHFAGFLDMQMTASKKVMATASWCNGDYYQYFDLYSGCGRWGDNQKGSPLVFLDAIERHDLPYRAVFIDRESINIERLRDSIPEYHRPYCTLLADDNKLALRPWLKVEKGKPKTYRMGLVYADPNGLVCWDLLSWMSLMKRYERTDIFVYFGANRGLKLHRRSYPGKYGYLTEYIEAIDKPHWLIRQPSTAWQWIFLYATRWRDKPQWKRAGFYDLDSDEGRRILYECNFTKDERAGTFQPGLFDL